MCESVSMALSEAAWRMLPAMPALRCFTSAISRDPYVTSCERSGCERCSDSIAGGPIIGECTDWSVRCIT